MSKSDKKSSNKIPLTNVLAIIGIVLLSFLFFFGKFYAGDAVGISIAWAVGFMAVLAVLLFLLVRAKTIETGFAHWRIFEWVVLAVYLLVVALSLGTTSRFVSIYVQHDKLKTATLADVEGIQDELQRFKEEESAALDRTCTGLQNAISYANGDNALSPALQTFFREQTNLGEGERPTPDVVTNFSDRWSRRIGNIIDAQSVSHGSGWNSELVRIRQKMSSFSIFDVPAVMTRLQRLNDDVCHTLEELSATLPFADVRYVSGRYDIRENHTPFSYSADVSLPNKMKNISDYSLLGILLTLCLHLLVLLNYFVASRSDKVNIGGLPEQQKWDTL